MNEELKTIAEQFCQSTLDQLDTYEPDLRKHVVGMLVATSIEAMVRLKGTKETAKYLRRIASDFFEDMESLKLH